MGYAANCGGSLVAVRSMKAAKGTSHIHWATPGHFLDLVYAFDSITLDPCWNDGSQIRAEYVCDGERFFKRVHEQYISIAGTPFTRPHYTPVDLPPGAKADGLLLDWPAKGLTYVNPPYAAGAMQLWAEKGAKEAARGREMIWLVAARPSTEWFQIMMAANPTSILWWGPGRLSFENPPGRNKCQRCGAAVDAHPCTINDDGNEWVCESFTQEKQASSVESLVLYFGERAARFREVFTGKGYFMVPAPL